MSAEDNDSVDHSTTTKVFVGNLDFQTREDELLTAFKNLNINVLGANVVTKTIRGSSRSMGFGFVELDESDVDEAVKQLNKSELAGRTINVERARSIEPKKKFKKRRPQRKRRPSDRVPKETESSEVGSTQERSPPQNRPRRVIPVKKEFSQKVKSQIPSQKEVPQKEAPNKDNDPENKSTKPKRKKKKKESPRKRKS